MIAHLQFTLTAEDEGQRLDVWLKRIVPSWSRGGIRSAIEEGRVRVGSYPVLRGCLLHTGDIVHLRHVPEPGDPPVTPDSTLSLSVLYEDETVVAVDKPAGLAVHPLRSGEAPTLASALLARYPEMAQACEDPLKPGLPDTLDTEASGIVLAARHADAFGALRSQLQRHEIRRTYLAMVRGTVLRAGRAQGSIVQDPGRPGRMKVIAPDRKWRGEKAMRATTSFRPLGSAKNYTLLEVIIRSNVLHQIRCHLAAGDLPIAGDALYGNAASPLPHRLLLHRSRMELVHPKTGQPLVLQCEPPSDWLALLRSLGIELAAPLNPPG